MMRDDPCGNFVLKGEQTAREHGIATLPVNLDQLASKHKIDLIPKPSNLTTGVSGMLLRVDKEVAIIYATHLVSIGFQRFSIAHELGHYFLHGESEDVKPHESHAGFVSNDKREREADCFAAGLLMPRRLFKDALRTSGEGLVAIESLANRCQTSLLATAIRFVHLSDDSIAIVVSTKDRIDYCFMSEEMKTLRGINWIRKNYPLPENTATLTFNQCADRVRHADRADDSSDLQDWFGGSRSLEIKEEVVGLGRYGKTLTVLTVPDLSDLEEIEEEDRLVESWKPRF